MQENVMVRIFAPFWIALILVQTFMALVSPVAGAEPWVVTDIAGKRHNLLDKKKKATVLIFVAHDCPISNTYAPEINRLSAAYTAQNIAFYIVYPLADLPVAEARKHAREYGYTCPALRDPAHRLVKKTQVTITPEVAVLSPGGKVLYRGRIDDRYAGYGKRRSQPRTRDLRVALEAVLKNKPVVPAVTRSIGCFIPTES